MRISGSYVDRLLITILPFTTFASIFIFFATKKDKGVSVIIMVFVFLTSLMWLIDSLLLYFKKLQTLTIEDVLYFDEIAINPEQVISIIPQIDKNTRQSFDRLKFEVENAGTIESYTVLQKPVLPLFNLFGVKSKTFTQLFEQFPELESKLQEETRI